MVTGDNLQTARAIALECGILGSDADATEPNIIEGKVFRAFSEAERLDIAEKISVRLNHLLNILFFDHVVVILYMQKLFSCVNLSLPFDT